MSQIFIMGASIGYGVGGETGGWADMLKLDMHNKLYSKGGAGESNEFYNFSKPGATADFVAKNYKEWLKDYRNDGEDVTVILSIGLNNSKAIDTPDNYVSKVGEFEDLMRDLIKDIKHDVDRLIFVGYNPCDESKTYPKLNPITGGTSYFLNDRIYKFNSTVNSICGELDVKFVDIDIDEEEWIVDHLYEDGIHPNKKGHEIIFHKIKETLKL